MSWEGKAWNGRGLSGAGSNGTALKEEGRDWTTRTGGRRRDTGRGTKGKEGDQRCGGEEMK